ncbi:Molybdate-binding periplasmic protein [Pontiella desulfatans]|uniref:Molybdate-binding periplasmic protein n=1 Tax=Pontiella desulfatans TaxID=2750659 RepID=A0A6C2U9G8_PONDE|nr:molybdate ABC transporter substrate-binding protein [Pontiella desulfatans]VGO16026.1 Molybdate-binding periplasmic protein [Pontiella desulfatans]
MKTLPTILSALCIALQVRADFTVFAAASTTDVLKELAASHKEQGGEPVRFNFASSGALARQIDAGAPADLFVSANAKWMDWLETQSACRKETRFDLAANSLVMVAPPGSSLAFDGTISGRVAVGDFKSVPAGMYAKEALEHLGWLETWRPNLVPTSSVRTALLYVQRGEVAAGIVYATDAQAAGHLEVVGTFPAEAHSPIVYPVAAISGNKAALQFLDFLKTAKAKAILKKHGFADPEKTNHKDSKSTKKSGTKPSCTSCLSGERK